MIRARNVEAPYGYDDAEVIITIRDINDNAPMFSISSGYVFNVPEITSVGSVVGTVAATDIDGGTRNGTVSGCGFVRVLVCVLVRVLVCVLVCVLFAERK